MFSNSSYIGSGRCSGDLFHNAALKTLSMETFPILLQCANMTLHDMTATCSMSYQDSTAERKDSKEVALLVQGGSADGIRLEDLFPSCSCGHMPYCRVGPVI